jgi:hypothetical protein
MTALWHTAAAQHPQQQHSSDNASETCRAAEDAPDKSSSSSAGVMLLARLAHAHQSRNASANTVAPEQFVYKQHGSSA